MFTGIVEELGRVRSITPHATGRRIVISAKTVLDDVQLGASIAVNGCCLTVVDFDGDEGWWAADVVEESVRRTNLGDLAADVPVNLERPVRLADRMGGHIVQGHVDGVGTIRSRTRNADDSMTVWVDAPVEMLRYVAEKGSITVDGVSLTVAAVDHTGFAFAMIPHTAAVTTLGGRDVGEAVNVEADLIAKYVEKLTTYTEGDS